MKGLYFFCLSIFIFPMMGMAGDPHRVVLSEKGKAKLPIVISIEASERHQAMAVKRWMEGIAGRGDSLRRKSKRCGLRAESCHWRRLCVAG